MVKAGSRASTSRACAAAAVALPICAEAAARKAWCVWSGAVMRLKDCIASA